MRGKFHKADLHNKLLIVTVDRLLLRDRDTVDAWVQSDKSFMVMRDHPGHGWHMLGEFLAGCNLRFNQLSRFLLQLACGVARQTNYPLSDHCLSP